MELDQAKLRPSGCQVKWIFATKIGQIVNSTSVSTNEIHVAFTKDEIMVLLS